MVWIGGFRSDMEGTKALALDAAARERGWNFVRYDHFAHGRSSGDWRQATIGRWREDAIALIDSLDGRFGRTRLAALATVLPVVAVPGDNTGQRPRRCSGIRSIMPKRAGGYATAMPRASDEHGSVMRRSGQWTAEPSLMTATTILTISGVLCVYLSGQVMYLMREREERAKGHSTRDAVEISDPRAGRAVEDARHVVPLAGGHRCRQERPVPVRFAPRPSPGSRPA